MSPVTHFLTGWVLASFPPLNRRERVAVTLAAVIPDLDGLGIAAELLTRHSSHPLLWFSLYHHSLRNLLFAGIVARLAFMLATRRWLTASCAFLAFHLHLIEGSIRVTWSRRVPVADSIFAAVHRSMDLGMGWSVGTKRMAQPHTDDCIVVGNALDGG